MSLTVSVVIPLYNHQAYIASTLNSVFAQTYPAKEIIVIDDGSRDDSAVIVQAISDERPEVIFWSQPNRGAHNTINLGIQRATGDLVAILNSDDLYAPNRLKRVVETFTESPSIEAVTTNLSFIDEREQPLASSQWFRQAFEFFQRTNDLALTLLNANIFITTSNLVARRKLFDEIGYFAELRYAHDLDFFLRLLARQREVRFLDEPLLQYRMHYTNTISEGRSNVKLEVALVAGFYLNQIWSGQDRPVDWSAAPAILELLRKHSFINLESVMMCFAYFRNNPSDTLEHHKFAQDETFLAHLRSVVELPQDRV